MLFLHYVVRKVLRRIGNNAVTIGVIGIVIAGSMTGFAFLAGLRAAAKESLPAEHVIVTAQGATLESMGMLTPDVANQIAVLPAIAKLGTEAAISSESVAQVLLDKSITRTGDKAPQPIRGVDPIGFQLHDVKIVEGKRPQPGEPELVVGLQARRRFPGLSIGSKIRLPGEEWTIVGAFTAGGSVYDGEVWADRGRLMKSFKQERINVMMIAASSPAEAVQLVNSINSSKRFEASAHTERDFRGSQAKLAQVLHVITLLVITLCVIGIFITATNLHASLITRVPEFATMIALGVRRGRVAALVFQESLVIAFLGLAIAIAIAFLIKGPATAMFSDTVQFQLAIGGQILGIGAVLAIVVGIAGALVPSLIIRRLDLIRGLR